MAKPIVTTAATSMHSAINWRMRLRDRTLKEATVRRYHYETHQQLGEHLEAFLAKRL